MTIKFYAKHFLVILTILPLLVPAQLIKNLSYYILSFVGKVLDSPAFNFVTGGEPIFGIYYNTILAGSISIGFFTITIIYLNYLIYKRLLKWEISFTPSLIFLTASHLLYFAISLRGIFLMYNHWLTYLTVTIGLIISLSVIFITFKRFDKNGNWTGIKN